ncbi:MAG: YbaN family protein [Phocaeicola sp.]|nr:YbaN family protein [Phocaeicola sp.]
MRLIYSIIGFISVLLGVIGIFLPVLPTTPFLLLAAALFFRSSPRAYSWLINHKYLGPYIRSFREDKSIPLRIKIISIGTLWLTAVHCIIFVFSHWWLKAFMIVLATCITIYILSFKTRKSS